MFRHHPLYKRLISGEKMYVKCVISVGDVTLRGDTLWAQSTIPDQDGVVKFTQAVHAWFEDGYSYMIYSGSENKDFELKWCDEVAIEEITEERYIKNVERKAKFKKVMSELESKGHPYESMRRESRCLRSNNDNIEQMTSQDFSMLTRDKLELYNYNTRRIQILSKEMNRMVLIKLASLNF